MKNISEEDEEPAENTVHARLFALLRRLQNPNDKRPPGLEAQGRDDAVGQISGRTTTERAPTHPHKTLRVGFTRLHLCRA